MRGWRRSRRRKGRKGRMRWKEKKKEKGEENTRGEIEKKMYGIGHVDLVR